MPWRPKTEHARLPKSMRRNSKRSSLSPSNSGNTISPDEEKLTRSLIIPHLEFLLPNSIAKNRSQLERGKEARKRLASYILSTDIPIAFTPLRTGRPALHTACFNGDLHFVQLVLEKLSCYDNSDDLLPESYLNTTCGDSGWAPIHYAALSGSTEILECLLAGGCNVTTITDDTHTWRERYVSCGAPSSFENTIFTLFSPFFSIFVHAVMGVV